MNTSLRQILVTDLELDPQALLPESSLEDAGVDSLALVELNLLLTQQVGVEIGEDTLASVTTVGALDRLVEQHLAGK